MQLKKPVSIRRVRTPFVFESATVSQECDDVGEALLKKLDLNSASASEMIRTLRGIGTCRARAIEAARPFKTPWELVEKGLLGEMAFERIAHRLFVKSQPKPSRS